MSTKVLPSLAYLTLLYGLGRDCSAQRNSSTGTAWMNTNSSGGGKEGSPSDQNLILQAQFLQRTWGRRARSARIPCWYECHTKVFSILGKGKFYFFGLHSTTKDKSIYGHTGLAADWSRNSLSFPPTSTAMQLCKQCINCRRETDWWEAKGSPVPSIHSLLQIHNFQDHLQQSSQAAIILFPKVWPNSSNCPFSALSLVHQNRKKFILT